MKSSYNITISRGQRITLNLKYREGGKPVSLDGEAAFFQVGVTKPVPGNIDGDVISFDFKPEHKLLQSVQDYKITLKNIETKQTTPIMTGTLKVDNGR